MSSGVVWELDGRLLDVLSEIGARFERVEAGAYVVALPGRRRPSTLLWSSRASKPSGSRRS